MPKKKPSGQLADEVAKEVASKVGKGRPYIPTAAKVTRGRMRHEKARARKAANRLGRGASITFPQYEKAWAVWMETNSITETARRIGMNRAAVSKLVNVGVPEYGWHSLRDRMVKVRVAQQEQADYTLVKAHGETTEIIRAFKRKLAQRVAIMDPEEIKASSLSADVNTLARLESFIMGEEDSRAKVEVSGTAQFEGWTVEEIVDFIETGRSPASKVRPGAERAVAKAMQVRQAGDV